MTFIEFTLNLLIVVLMIIDEKSKKLTDWLIIAITFFNADIGIILFIAWTFYKEWTQRYEAQKL